MSTNPNNAALADAVENNSAGQKE
jgi:hypothetical protein